MEKEANAYNNCPYTLIFYLLDTHLFPNILLKKWKSTDQRKSFISVESFLLVRRIPPSNKYDCHDIRIL